MTVLFKPILGLLNQPKFLPLSKMGPMVLELELVDEFTDPVVTSEALLNPPETDANKFTPANTSNDWQIENVQVKTDLVSLDNGLQNTYDSSIIR